MPMKVRYTVLDGEIVSENRGGVERDYVPDPLGSTVALLDSNQAKTDTFEYWPYGEERARTGSTQTPFRFVGSRGYYRDTPELSYVRSRHTHVKQGRWLTEDPLSYLAGPNLYGYVANQPVSTIDPSGLATIKICFAPALAHLPGVKHSWLVVCDNSGHNCTVFEAGPAKPPSNALNPFQDFGELCVYSKGKSWMPPDNCFTIKTDSKPAETYTSQLELINMVLETANLPYKPFSTNSNWYVGALLTCLGLPTTNPSWPYAPSLTPFRPKSPLLVCPKK